MRVSITILFVLNAALSVGAQPIPREIFTHAAMGTKFAFTIYARPGDTGTRKIAQIAAQAFDAVDALERRISVWKADTEVTYLNAHAAVAPVAVSQQLMDLLIYCRKVHDETHGAFDVTVGPLVELWGFYRTDVRASDRPPSKTTLSEVCARVGSEKLVVDVGKRTVSFAREGMRLDFGGVGKGLALDIAADILERNSVTAAALSAGSSSIVTIGAPPDASGWRVAVRNPSDTRVPLDEIVLRDEALATSADYERFVEIDGKKYGHILDPRTGHAVEGTVSTTVIGPSGRETDALSTAFFVMGLRAAEEYCKIHPAFRAIIVPGDIPGHLRPTRIGVWPDRDLP